jgi:putative ATPase
VGADLETLFDAAMPPRLPLASRMRPVSLDEVVGQDHLLGAGSPLRRLVESGPGSAAAVPPSVLLWGPPGTGKTTLARIIAGATGRRFVELSAVSAGVKEVRDTLVEARRTTGMGGGETVLFLDEVHRFSKAQQDTLLHAVEDRTVILVAATTENPHFSVISPLLSRSLLLTLRQIDDVGVGTLIDRALADERGLDGLIGLELPAREHLVRVAGGDARRALTALEAAAGAALDLGEPAVTLERLEQAVAAAAARYDRDGDQHYDVISAFIKSVRGSDPDAALHYLARMIEAGEDPRFIARRLVILASEDVGLADPTALPTAVAAAQAVALIGLPEARLNLAQATIALAVAPKSNAVINAINAAQADLAAGLAGPVPAHLRDGHYPGAAKLGHGVGYRYAHDYPHGVVEQQYAPDQIVGRDYYRPTTNGAERDIAERTGRLRRAVRGDGTAGQSHS